MFALISCRRSRRLRGESVLQFLPVFIRKRPGWSEIPAVRHDRIVEIKSPLILQPGPAALTDGLDAIVAALWPFPSS